MQDRLKDFNIRLYPTLFNLTQPDPTLFDVHSVLSNASQLIQTLSAANLCQDPALQTCNVLLLIQACQYWCGTYYLMP